jgi:hypothetical protein
MEMVTLIDGCKVTFMEYDDETGNTNNCYVEKGKWSHSLALIQDLGGFEDDCGNILPIKESTLQKIEKWALSKGY